MSWRAELRALEYEAGEDFENYAECAEKHLLNLLGELGTAAQGNSIDVNLALAELAMAATNLNCLRDHAISMLRTERDKAGAV